MCEIKKIIFFFRFYCVGGSGMSLVQTVKVLASLLVAWRDVDISSFFNHNVS